jgi:hypothetical protein
LCHFKYGAPDSVSISDADLVIGKTIDCEVFSKLPILKIVSSEMKFPVSIGTELVDHYGALFPSVTCKVPLAIAIEIQSTREDSVCYGPLPDCGSDQLTLPLNLTREADIY